jgi:hypothetical protein
LVTHVQDVADAARFQASAEALARFNQTPLGTVREGTLELHTLDSGPGIFYALREGRLASSTDRSQVASLLEPPEGFRSVANSESYVKLQRRLPESCIFLLAVDLRTVSQLVVPLVLGSAAFGFGPSPGQLQAALRPILDAPQGLSLALALRGEPDAFVVSIETLGVDPLKMAPGLLPLALEAMGGM